MHGRGRGEPSGRALGARRDTPRPRAGAAAAAMEAASTGLAPPLRRTSPPPRGRHRRKDPDLKRSLQLSLVAALAVAGAGQAAEPPAAPPTLLAQATLASPPAAFVALPDGSMLLLDGLGDRLLRVTSEGAVEPRPLAGAGFDPAEAHLVDMDLSPAGEVLLLDESGGTLWRARPDGRVLGRFGLFVNPVELGRGPAGMVAVWDPGVGSVTLFDRELEPVAHLEGEALSPQATPDGRLPVLEPLVEGRGLRILSRLPAPGGSPADAGSGGAPQLVAELHLDPSEQFVDAQVLGSFQGALLLHVLTLPRGAPERALSWLVTVGTGAGGAPHVERAALAVPENWCLDCGPTLRLSRDGRVLAYDLQGEQYRVLQLAAAGGAR